MLRRTLGVVLTASLAWLGSDPAHAARGKKTPPKCLGGYYVLDGPPLVAGAAAPDALVVGLGEVSTLSGCPRQTPRLFRGKRGRRDGPGTDLLVVKWPACGTLKRATLRAEIDADCTLVKGTFKAKGQKRRRWTATDGIPAGLREPWDTATTPLPPDAQMVNPADFLAASRQPDPSRHAAADRRRRSRRCGCRRGQPGDARRVRGGVSSAGGVRLDRRRSERCRPRAERGRQLPADDLRSQWEREQRRDARTALPTGRPGRCDPYVSDAGEPARDLRRPFRLREGQPRSRIARRRPGRRHVRRGDRRAQRRRPAQLPLAQDSAGSCRGERSRVTYPARCGLEIGAGDGTDGANYCAHPRRTACGTPRRGRSSTSTRASRIRRCAGRASASPSPPGASCASRGSTTRWINLSEQHLYYAAKRSYSRAGIGDGLDAARSCRQLFDASVRTAATSGVGLQPVEPPRGDNATARPTPTRASGTAAPRPRSAPTPQARAGSSAWTTGAVDRRAPCRPPAVGARTVRTSTHRRRALGYRRTPPTGCRTWLTPCTCRRRPS